MSSGRSRPVRADTAGSRAERADLTRQRLIDTGRSLFTTKGYFDTSLEEIVEQAGFTQGALYHHFGSKRGLFEAVFRIVERRWRLPDLDQAKSPEHVWQTYHLDHVEEGDAWTIFSRGMVSTVSRLSRRAADRIILYRDGPAVLGWDEWRRIQLREQTVAFAAAAVTEAMEQGVIGEHEPRVLASMLLAAQEEAGVSVARTRSRAAKEAICLELECLFAALRVVPDGRGAVQ